MYLLLFNSFLYNIINHVIIFKMTKNKWNLKIEIGEHLEIECKEDDTNPKFIQTKKIKGNQFSHIKDPAKQLTLYCNDRRVSILDAQISPRSQQMRILPKDILNKFQFGNNEKEKTSCFLWKCLFETKRQSIITKRKKSFFEIRNLQPPSEPDKTLYSPRRRPSIFMVTENKNNTEE